MADADGSKHITLDRTNLKRLAALMAETPTTWPTDAMPADMLAAMKAGWRAAVECLDQLADESPELYGDHGWPAVRSDR